MRIIILHIIYAAIILSALYLAYDMGRFEGKYECVMERGFIGVRPK